MRCYLCKKPMRLEELRCKTGIGSVHLDCLEVFRTHESKLKTIELSSLSEEDSISLRDLIFNTAEA